MASLIYPPPQNRRWRPFFLFSYGGRSLFLMVCWLPSLPFLSSPPSILFHSFGLPINGYEKMKRFLFLLSILTALSDSFLIIRGKRWLLKSFKECMILSLLSSLLPVFSSILAFFYISPPLAANDSFFPLPREKIDSLLVKFCHRRALLLLLERAQFFDPLSQL